MKKLFAILFVAAALVTSAFAADFEVPGVEFEMPAGSFIDSNWNAEWVITADLHVTLKDSVSGEVIYDFTEDKISNVQKSITKTDGIVYSFECAETERRYYFSKPLTSLNTKLFLEIDPTWTNENYKVEITFKK